MTKQITVASLDLYVHTGSLVKTPRLIVNGLLLGIMPKFGLIRL